MFLYKVWIDIQLFFPSAPSFSVFYIFDHLIYIVKVTSIRFVLQTRLCQTLRTSCIGNSSFLFVLNPSTFIWWPFFFLMILFQTLLVQFSNHGSCMQRKANQVFRIIHEFRMTRWLCQIQTRLMVWWHISAITCQIFMLTRQKKIITTNSLLSWFYGVLTLFAAIYSSICDWQVDIMIWHVDIIT